MSTAAGGIPLSHGGGVVERYFSVNINNNNDDDDDDDITIFTCAMSTERRAQAGRRQSGWTDRGSGKGALPGGNHDDYDTSARRIANDNEATDKRSRRIIVTTSSKKKKKPETKRGPTFPR